MNVKIISTGEIESVNESYGCRLIEQGKAVLAPARAEESTTKAPRRRKDVSADVSERENQL